MQEIDQSNEQLLKKLEELKQKGKQVYEKNNDAHLKPLLKSKFIKKPEKYQRAKSQINYDLIMQKKRQKDEFTETKKIELEFEGCTFQPEINNNTTEILDHNYKNIFDRDLPRKSQTPPPREEKGMSQVYDPHPKRNYNTKFYEEQVNWKKELTENNNKKRMNNVLNEINSLQKKPIVNKKKNEKLVKREKDFLERVKKNQEATLKKKKKIEKQIYNATFKPAIHRKNKVKPQVFENENGLYSTLKKEQQIQFFQNLYLNKIFN